MKPKYAVILCVLVLLVSACAQKVNDPADVQAIKDISAAWDKAWTAGNAETLASFYAADAIVMDPNKPASVGKDAFRASCEKYFDQFSDENSGVVEDVRVSGDLAVAWGTQETKTAPKAGGPSFRGKSKWIDVFQRQRDGSWKIIWDIYNSDLPVAETLAVGAEEQALMQVERDWAAASAKNDWAAMDKILGAEYVHNSDGQTLSKKQLIANMKSGGLKYTSAEPGEMKVLVLGETGIVHGLWSEKSILKSRDLSGNYRYTDIFAKRDGRWQAVSTYSTKLK